MAITIISSKTDLVNYLNDTRADLGSEYVDAIITQIQFSDHPAYGQDWSDWLDAEMPALIDECVRSIDALK